MSQARKIYEFVAATANPAADTALVLALRRAEEPYRTTLLETLLDRGRAAAIAEVVADFHLFTAAQQNLVIQRSEVLFAGLRLAERAPAPQTRLNALAIIRRTHYYKLADVTATLLRDQDHRISQEAAVVLLELAGAYAREIQPALLPASGPTAYDVTPQALEKRTLLAALDTAVRTFKTHRRAEAVLAAMLLIPADHAAFWRDQLELHHPVGQAVRLLLTNHDRPELALFCLSALKHNRLRPAAARAIALHQRTDYIIAVARHFATAAGDKQLARGLSLVKQPRWLCAKTLPPASLSPADQPALATLVAALGASPVRISQYLAEMTHSATCRAGLKTVAILARRKESLAISVLVRAIDSPHEPVALAALVQLIKKTPAQLPRIVARQLASLHPRLQETARRYYQSIAFRAYWKNFDRLPPPQQRAAGKAVFKLDPGAHNRWQRRAALPLPALRLRAAQMARVLSRGVPCQNDLIRLAHDSDQTVRSCAVAALGEIPPQQIPGLEGSLFVALEDEDPRVRANAVEALGRRDARPWAQQIAQLMQDANNRVRANAIKTLLTWKVDSAQRAIREMLQDPRPRHRLSARWVVQQTESLTPPVAQPIVWPAAPLSDHSENIHVMAAFA